MNNYKVKPASSTRSAMLKMEQQISDNLSSVRDSVESPTAYTDSYSEYMQKQFRLINQIKREIHHWENYDYQKAQGSSLFNDDYDIYQIMLNLTHEFVENYNNKINKI